MGFGLGREWGFDLSQVDNKSYWNRFGQGLTVDGPYISSVKFDTEPYDIPHEWGEFSKRMEEEGYFDLPLRPNSRTSIDSLADLVARLGAQGIPPVFLYLYDAPWFLFKSVAPLLGRFLGNEFVRLPDFWAWHVGSGTESAGWRPHRDKGHSALDSEGRPIALTCWVPLTDATTLNGCMYILPANTDPVYGTKEDTQWKIDLASIRALPAERGTLFCWNQAVLHWGSKFSSRAHGPRISIAMEFQKQGDGYYNLPVSSPLALPDFAQKLWLVAKQMVQYKHMYSLPESLSDWAQSKIQEGFPENHQGGLDAHN